MPEGNDQNQNTQGPTATPTFPSQESGVYDPTQSNGSVDGINGGTQPAQEINLGPNQIAPNLAKEGGYFEEHSASAAPQGIAPQGNPEMQYPSYGAENESSFNLKLILIISVVGVILLGSVFGIIYFLKSRNADVAEEELTITQEDPQKTTDDQPKTDTETQAPAATPTPAPVFTPAAPVPAPVAQPKIETPQPKEKSPDNTEGRG